MPEQSATTRAVAALNKLFKLSTLPAVTPEPLLKLPVTSQARLSSNDPKTILYLAYGSNLSAETFKGTRGIRPLSSINAHIPSLTLTFDLPGIPYLEPCFANTRYRDPSRPVTNSDYHKDRWHKGLIGVVYEVTLEDYRTIIATEGGGASYQDVVVPCFAIPKGSTTVDPSPEGATFEAHTLLQPRSEDKNARCSPNGRIQRPDPSYAQASARYMKLITDGAEEHGLPSEYLVFLYNIRPYAITTSRQRVGRALFLLFWLPFIALFFILGRVFADHEGKMPPWMVKFTVLLFSGLWGSYDLFFKRIFGDGERTVTKVDEENGHVQAHGMRWCEKSVRLEEHGHKR